MTDLRNTCKDSNEYIKKLVVEYKENHIKLQERELLVGENNIEKRDIKGYHGREILELLQNADDAYQKSIKEGNKPNKPLEVCISYKNNIFSICNTGTVFDKEGMKAIVQGNNSPKDGKYIGNKGTGFRSILNWAKNVKILSGGFNVLFSKQIADDFFESIKRNSIPNKKEINFQKNNEKNSHINAQQNSDDTKFPIERTYTKNDIDEKNEHLKGIGNTGELVIYNYLCKEYGKENVFPRSEAFVTLGILKAGQARSSKYDLSYKTQDGVEYFVEVKAGHRNKFFISPEELDFAKNNSKHYKLFYVFNLNKNEPDCYELPSNFWEDERFKKNEIIEKIEYTF